jgi:formylglycine-generating enzyme required for sulfatase activity
MLRITLFLCVAAAACVCRVAIADTTADNDSDAMKRLKAQNWTVPGIDLAMRRIPAGSFKMGSPADEVARDDDEQQHKVKISKPFYMAIYETRQREYYPLMIRKDFDLDAWRYQRGPLHEGAAWTYRSTMNGRNIATPNIPRTDLNPMECVTWAKAMLFCKKITDKERAADRLPKGYVYRLPTEAEWEYACRAGTSGPYSFEGDHSSLRTLNAYACFFKSHGYKSLTTSPTPASRKPNAWGLYDMHGNVFEWCLDWYGPYPSTTSTSSGQASSGQASSPQEDPTGPTIGTERVARGGGVLTFEPSAGSLAKLVHPHFRSAARYGFPPRTAYQINLGFRIVLAPEVEVYRLGMKDEG